MTKCPKCGCALAFEPICHCERCGTCYADPVNPQFETKTGLLSLEELKAQKGMEYHDWLKAKICASIGLPLQALWDLDHPDEISFAE